jgi:tripeptide aminopeptidase
MNIADRFLAYARIGTPSDPESGTHPSSPEQFELARYLVDELTAMGLENPHLEEHCYVYAWLPATPGMEHIPTLGLIAHMDTSSAVPGAPVNPRVVKFDGSPIVLKEGLVLEPNPAYVGQSLIVTDGNTLLGADDKAGIATIVSAVEYLLEHPEIPHGRIALGFTPDEEIGEGPMFFDIEGFGAKTAYTVDGGELGEIEYENFNAAGCKVTVHGINIHPGSAKNVMKNSILIANEFISMLPAAETPAHTQDYEGFFHVNGISGDENETVIQMLVRDHDSEKYDARNALLEEIGSFLNAKYGTGTVEVEIKESYRNMKEQIEPHMYLIDNAKAAMEQVGVTPKVIPIRGGTDGALLSYMGLPCPNLCTCGANFHSLKEYVPIPAMEKMVEVLVALIQMQK